MKKIIYIIWISLLTMIFVSCNEDEWLKEEPHDFFTGDNAYENLQDFQIAVNHLYRAVKESYYHAWPPWHSNFYWYGTDMGWDAIGETHRFNKYEKIVPESWIADYYWSTGYEIISNANAIIDRIDNVEFGSDTERNKVIAQARFFRAHQYRMLGILYGDVPIVLNELKGPKRDFQRDPLEDVWAQCKSDLQYAVENLPTVNERKADGKLTKAAANHLLTEIHIITEDWDKAINTASAVIESGDYHLMKDRFGSRADEAGDVYWDLFRRGNQNRSSGNMESIWVCQYEYKTDGGGPGNMNLWVINPEYWNLKGPEGNNLFRGPTEKYGGRSVGWFSSSFYMDTLIWRRSGAEGVELQNISDIRTSDHNIMRDLVADNPNSDYYGQKLIEDDLLQYNSNSLRRQWHCLYTKLAPINNFPSDAISDPETGETTSEAITFTDTYIYRLAETYLLRAEAYLGKGDPTSAADDINAVRERANAQPVTPSDVDLDYILDERARELHWEGTHRQFTLRRTDKLLERVREYNPIAVPIQEKHKLLPIPQSEIERNTEATLEQNPGY